MSFSANFGAGDVRCEVLGLPCRSDTTCMFEDMACNLIHAKCSNHLLGCLRTCLVYLAPFETETLQTLLKHALSVFDPKYTWVCCNLMMDIPPFSSRSLLAHDGLQIGLQSGRGCTNQDCLGLPEVSCRAARQGRSKIPRVQSAGAHQSVVRAILVSMPLPVSVQARRQTRSKHSVQK